MVYNVIELVHDVSCMPSLIQITNLSDFSCGRRSILMIEDPIKTRDTANKVNVLALFKTNHSAPKLGMGIVIEPTK